MGELLKNIYIEKRRIKTEFAMRRGKRKESSKGKMWLKKKKTLWWIYVKTIWGRTNIMKNLEVWRKVWKDGGTRQKERKYCKEVRIKVKCRKMQDS